MYKILFAESPEKKINNFYRDNKHIFCDFLHYSYCKRRKSCLYCYYINSGIKIVNIRKTRAINTVPLCEF